MNNNTKRFYLVRRRKIKKEIKKKTENNKKSLLKEEKITKKGKIKKDFNSTKNIICYILRQSFSLMRSLLYNNDLICFKNLFIDSEIIKKEDFINHWKNEGKYINGIKNLSNLLNESEKTINSLYLDYFKIFLSEIYPKYIFSPENRHKTNKVEKLMFAKKLFIKLSFFK